MTDRIRAAPDVPFRQVGIGYNPTWLCMGCGKPRPATGSRGKGVHRRCAVCIKKAKDQKNG